MLNSRWSIRNSLAVLRLTTTFPFLKTALTTNPPRSADFTSGSDWKGRPSAWSPHAAACAFSLLLWLRLESPSSRTKGAPPPHPLLFIELDRDPP
eukprot:CAMPEP_0119537688 /NCGR_PEP_ID=MMETSP1344-20130328/50298_1 /TAXON_ID=236787 /ORGANISM="Florenciella parvula, Strain CCMP2471" /LENGTH=94 /DNA_ID=CAMNT_0007580287 /DNA_START=353 /DNA_END=634 /DNA_ORIENTATION=+